MHVHGTDWQLINEKYPHLKRTPVQLCEKAQHLQLLAKPPTLCDLESEAFVLLNNTTPKKTCWSEESTEMLRMAIVKYGPHWTTIVDKCPQMNRTVAQIKERVKNMKKKLCKEGKDLGVWGTSRRSGLAHQVAISGDEFNVSQ